MNKNLFQDNFIEIIMEKVWLLLSAEKKPFGS